MKNRLILFSLRVLVLFAILFISFNTDSIAQNLSFNKYNGEKEIAATESIKLTNGFLVPKGSTFRAYITNVNCAPLASVPSVDQNYIVSNYIKKQFITDASQLSGLNICELNQTIQYFDGLGRLAQTVAVKESPAQKDVVLPVVYDDAGREATIPFLCRSGYSKW
ncbi:DUF6443 domain-containing protein [Pedobacter cryoconitis]|uniref:DUF6443 domain-containing protein n=1 Tax=Pedobacter cryoconitis TaxID=188932 RepID=UPI00160B4323|nr:DUF6443 domain-containing protein [Pedobacter cryoconitis]MBB5644210.1 hypothetical protein [Pedobacter cryoconitis]